MAGKRTNITGIYNRGRHQRGSSSSSMHMSIEMDKKQAASFEKMVNALEKQSQGKIAKICNDIAKELVQKIKINIAEQGLIKNGNLQKSIKLKKVGVLKNGFIIARVMVDSNIAWYWHFVEFPSKNKRMGRKRNSDTRRYSRQDATSRTTMQGDKAFIRNTVRDYKGEEKIRNLIKQEYNKIIN